MLYYSRFAGAATGDFLSKREEKSKICKSERIFCEIFANGAEFLQKAASFCKL